MSGNQALDDQTYIAWTKQQIKEYLHYATLIVTPTGLILNTLMIIVFSRKKFHKKTMGFYYIILAIFDNCALTMQFCEYFSVAIGSDLALISNTSCPIVFYFMRLTAHIPSWIQVLITYDRMISVRFHKRFTFNQKKKNIALAVLMIVIALMLVNMTNFWFHIVVTVSNVSITNTTFKVTTSKTCSSYSTLVFARDLLNAFLRSVGPFTLMIIGNIILIKALIKSKKNSNRQAHPHSSNSKIKLGKIFGKEQQFAASIMAMNVFFMIFYLPQASTILLQGIFAYKPELAPATTEATIILIFNIAVYIGLINNSVACLINLKFNKIFREEFYHFLFDIKVKLKMANASDYVSRSGISPSQTNNNNPTSKIKSLKT